MPKFLLRAELHCHTFFSDGFSSVEECIQEAKTKKLNVLAITDHDTADGVLDYWDNQPDELILIPGEEISTDRGHVIGLFVRENIKPGLYNDVIKQLKEQKAVIIIPHPFHIPLGNIIRKKKILKFENNDLIDVDGIEVYNAHNRVKANQIAKKWSKEFDKTLVSGSDAHFISEIGNAITEIHSESKDFDGVYSALKMKKTIPYVPNKNNYLNYLLIGLMNKWNSKRYIYPPKI